MFPVSIAGVVLATVVAAATSVHLPVSTTSPGAQAAIDRGLFLYYAYNRDDAAAAFSRAASLDSHLAMAYWGIALAAGPDLNNPMTAERFDRGARAIRRAEAMATVLPTGEGAFIAAMAQRYRGKFADWSRDDSAYREAMLRFARDSRDENAQLLAAEASLEIGGLDWQGDAPASQASRDAFELINGVLKRDPTNPMANHLCIHVYDLAPDRSAALPCAQRLDAVHLPAGAEHLAHMPAHYWIETGNYTNAEASSERAYSLLTPTGDAALQPARYGKHDMVVGYSASMMLGNYTVARRWAQRMAIVFDDSFAAITALRFGRYADAYSATGEQFEGPSVRGLAAIHLGRLTEAHAIGARVRAGNTKQGYLPQLFLGRLAESDGNYDEAVHWIELAQKNQDADFGGELIPLFPAGEALGELNLRRGDAARAIAAFNDVLRSYPNDPRALFGLAKALQMQSHPAQAAAARSRFEMEWKGADTNAGDALP
jgi:tetratricopeptide (TPR) repeat protein